MEEDCKRLEDKLQIAMKEQKKLSDYQTELDDAKLKAAQMEITQESWKKKYEKVASEKKDLLAKISKLDLELLNLKRTAKLEDSDDVKLKIARFQAENETLKNQCDSLLSERNTCKEKISKLETELFDMRKKVSSLEGRLRKSGEITLNSKSEKELSRHKDLVAQLSRLNNSKEGRVNESAALEERIQQLEHDLRSKDEKLSRQLEDFQKIKDERDQLVSKLRNQAKNFKQYVKSQNQKDVSAELNLSPRSTGDSTDLQKMREIVTKEVREEMEQKVAKELRGIGEQNRKDLEKYKTTILELQKQCSEKDQEMETLRKKILAEQMEINQIIKSKLEMYSKELQARKLYIEKLKIDLKQKENEVEEDRNYMAEIMTAWIAELKESKAKEKEKDEKIQKLKSIEGKLNTEIKTLRDKQKHVKNKYRKAKQTADNYKVRIREVRIPAFIDYFSI